jgi:ubiquinone/menaquinone biosynthesis C-methylase UbiE
LENPDYRDNIEHVYVMDVNEENINFCVERFRNSTCVHPTVNNGNDFGPIKSESVSAIFCYDAMVHFEYDAVISYLKDAFRILVPGGRGLFHHSNYDRSPGALYTENPGWRNFMSKELFAHIASRSGFRILEQSVINWDGGRKLDCISLIEKPESADQGADRDNYHAIAERHYDQTILAMLDLMQVEPGATILEVGCGSGANTLRIARAGKRVCAADVSQNMLQQAQARVAAAGLESIVEFRLEDLTRLTFPDATFRHVFSWDAITRIHDVEKALDELARIIEPGGNLALYVSNNRSWDQNLETLARFVLRKPMRNCEAHPLGKRVWREVQGDRLWVWHFNIDQLERELESRGLVLTHTAIGELSKIYSRVGGPLREMLLRVNRVGHRLNVPPGPAAQMLLVFQKT